MPFPDGRARRVKKAPPARVELNIWVVVASRRAFTPGAAAAHRATESRGWKSLEAPPPSPRPRRPRAREMEGQQGIDALVSGAVGRVRDAVRGRAMPRRPRGRGPPPLTWQSTAAPRSWSGEEGRRPPAAWSRPLPRATAVTVSSQRRWRGGKDAASRHFDLQYHLLVRWGGQSPSQQPVEPGAVRQGVYG